MVRWLRIFAATNSRATLRQNSGSSASANCRLRRKHTLQPQPMGEAIEPATIGKMRDRFLRPAQALKCGGGKLHIAEHVDLRDLADPHFLDGLVAFPYL